MPTNRHRYVLTETDELAAALTLAAHRLVKAGGQALNAEQEQSRTRRRQAVARTHGQFRDMYGPDYLKRLRDDWPA